MNLSDKLLYYAIDWTMRLVPRQPLSHAALPPLCRQRARLYAYPHACVAVSGWVGGCVGWVRGRMEGWGWMGRPGGWVDGWGWMLQLTGAAVTASSTKPTKQE